MPPSPSASPPGLPPYAELQCLSNFSFLQGASHPKELVEQAAQLGYAALAITDECSLAGVVRALVAAERSEEHTSELQSLMSISYAVFCLKTKTNQSHM